MTQQHTPAPEAAPHLSRRQQTSILGAVGLIVLAAAGIGGLTARAEALATTASS